MMTTGGMGQGVCLGLLFALVSYECSSTGLFGECHDLRLVCVDLHPGFFAPRLAHVDRILQFLCICGHQTQIIHIQDSCDPYAVAIMCNGFLWESALEFVYQVLCVKCIKSIILCGGSNSGE